MPDEPQKLTEVTVTLPNGTVTTMQLNDEDRKRYEAAGQVKKVSTATASTAKNKARSTK